MVLEIFGNSTEQLGGSVNRILTNCEQNVYMLATTHSPNLFLISENETQSFLIPKHETQSGKI